MLNFNKKREIKEMLYSKIVIGLLGIIFIFIANGTWNVYKKASFASGNKNVAENSLNKLKVREKILTRDISTLKTPRGVEAQVRNKFGFVKKGEEVVVVVNQDKANSHNKENNIGYSSGWWNKILSYLGKLYAGIVQW